jgi:steroid delta-isomerase-like uncharacterized protein
MKNSLKLAAIILIVSAIGLLSGCDKKGMPADIKKTFDKYIGYWNGARFDEIEKIMAEDFEIIESPDYVPQIGISPFKKLITNTRTTFPDFKLEVNEIVYEKDKVALIWTVTGTNKGPGEIPPTGRTINGKGISVIHFKDGKIKDEWLGNNNLLWLMQLGYKVVPPAPVSAPAK